MRQMTMREVERTVDEMFPDSSFCLDYTAWNHRHEPGGMAVECSIWIVSLNKNFSGPNWNVALERLKDHLVGKDKVQDYPDEEPDAE